MTRVIEQCLRANGLPPYSIVAVNGLNGHRESTFTAAKGIFWLSCLLPEQSPNIRVLSYGYDARTYGSSLLNREHLNNHAERLIEELRKERTIAEVNTLKGGNHFPQGLHADIVRRLHGVLLSLLDPVRDIDAFSRASAPIVEGLRRKTALMTFWGMLDCIGNWAKDKKANGRGGGISAEEYFGQWMDIVRGLSHMWAER